MNSDFYAVIHCKLDCLTNLTEISSKICDVICELKNSQTQETFAACIFKNQNSQILYSHR